MSNSSQKIGIVGSGLIGRSWAMLFTSVGYNISIFDVVQKQVSTALEDILKQLKYFESAGILKGTDSAEVQFSRIKGVTSLEECVKDAFFIQECVPEDLDLKIKVFKQLDSIVDSRTILSSSTSCIVPSKFTKDLANRSNCIVSHPTNPPYLVPFTEVVPAPWTSSEVVQVTRKLMIAIGQKPAVFKKEFDGFGSNRIQYAILRECYHLVNDDIMAAEDVDVIMKYGLAYRYLWMGPLETAHLNAEGWGSYVERYGSTMTRVAATLKSETNWTMEGTTKLRAQMEEMVPTEKLEERRKWRDERLLETAALVMKMEKKEKNE